MRAAGALDRVIFSSFEHEAIHQLCRACPEARCGLLWDVPDAAGLSAEVLLGLPEDFTLHLPLAELRRRPGFWRPWARRLAVWGMERPREADELGFRPAILIADGT